MDLNAAAREGIRFFTHKLTEGTRTRQLNGGKGLSRARTAGIPFLGGYLVTRTPGNGGHGSVPAQVEYFLSWADALVPWWPAFPGWFWQVDSEHWGYDNVPASVGHEAALLLTQRTGRAVLHYAPEWAYGNSVPCCEPLWASSYVAGSGSFGELYPGDGSARWHAYSGRVPAILQYTDKATIAGQGPCDANAFRGTVADFAELIGGRATTPAGDDMYFLVQFDDPTVYLTNLIHYRLVYESELEFLQSVLDSYGGTGEVQIWTEAQRPALGVPAGPEGLLGIVIDETVEEEAPQEPD